MSLLRKNHKSGKSADNLEYTAILILSVQMFIQVTSTCHMILQDDHLF